MIRKLLVTTVLLAGTAASAQATCLPGNWRFDAQLQNPSGSRPTVPGCLIEINRRGEITRGRCWDAGAEVGSAPDYFMSGTFREYRRCKDFIADLVIDGRACNNVRGGIERDGDFLLRRDRVQQPARRGPVPGDPEMNDTHETIRAILEELGRLHVHATPGPWKADTTQNIGDMACTQAR